LTWLEQEQAVVQPWGTATVAWAVSPDSADLPTCFEGWIWTNNININTQHQNTQQFSFNISPAFHTATQQNNSNNRNRDDRREKKKVSCSVWMGVWVCEGYWGVVVLYVYRTKVIRMSTQVLTTASYHFKL
jgi:hypothetical protein